MSDRTYVTALLLGCVIVLAGLVWGVVSLTGPPRSAHRPEIEPVSTSQFSQLSEQIAKLSDQVSRGGGSNGAPRRHAPEVGPGEIPVLWIDRHLPIDDPHSSEWDAAADTAVPLQVQDQAMPVLDELTIDSVRVRALSDGRQIAWRITWNDDGADYHLDADLFCDAVAIQFPLKANAAYTMGDREFPVQIMQWKAIWQKDIDEHFQDVQDLHPNYWADLYWFAEGEFPYPVPESFQRTEALDWFVAYRAGNPMAELYRRQPVQELIAEGFGTLTNQPDSVSVARGVWKDGVWSVVFARPMTTTDSADFQFEPGVRNVVAFAVWEGSTANVSGRKHHSQWIVFEVGDG